MFNPLPLLKCFAEMVERSCTFDGDRQGDGWGAAWQNADGTWQRYRSLLPVWEDTASFSRAPPTSRLAIHARSASFAEHIGNLEHNQPYITTRACFVFNGIFRGSRLPAGLEGEIGSQKVWSLIQRFLQSYPPEQALEKTARVLKQVTADLQAVNVGLISGDGLYALNLFTRNPKYYRLHIAAEKGLSCIASEHFGCLPFSPSRQGEVMVL
ncbi:MAG: hypothetical protein N2691_01605 [Patescibacteria group bacterium]|nr:hypothetical protein [Patescibacteria group bacterium]